MDFEIVPVPLDRIDTTDLTFQITTAREETDLARSIGAIGLLQPPTLLDRQGDTYGVVCGFRRISACRLAGLTTIVARRLPMGTSRSRCARMAVADNAAQRPLNVIEQSRACALLRACADDPDRWMELIPGTGLPASRIAIERILPVATMPHTLQMALLEGTIALPVALAIQRFSPEATLALCGLFRRMATGLNIQREVLALIGDLCLRDDIPIAALVASDEIAALLDREEVPAPQRVHALRKLLRVKRYPALSQAETNFAQRVNALHLNPRLQLHPPPFFEGRTYRLTLSFDCRRELKALLPDLEKLVDDPQLLPDCSSPDRRFPSAL